MRDRASWTIFAAAFVLTASLTAADAASPTFYKDVLPVLQQNCQECHRPGEAAPMSFMSFEETRPWAQAIREAVLLRRMPPWTAEPGVGKKFHNERRLSDSDIQTLDQWASSGAAAGDKKDAPPAAEFVEGWNIGHPDKVWTLPKPYAVPDEGTIEYTYLIIPNAFPEDTWVSAAEIRPDARPVIHHIIAYLRPQGSTWLEGYETGEFFVPADRKAREQKPPNVKPTEWRQSLAGYAPGFRPRGPHADLAQFVPAGTDLVFELHYTADGQAVTDQSSVGIVTAKAAPARRKVGGAVLNTRFEVPPGAPNHPVTAAVEFKEQATLLDLTPHMHLRGKSFEYRAVYPTGESEILVSVPKYDFNWQITYELERPLVVPAGTRIECTAHFDNSPNNPFNPDPATPVHWGDQSWEEMMIGFFTLSLDMDQDPNAIYAGVKPEKKAGSSGSDD